LEFVLLHYDILDYPKYMTTDLLRVEKGFVLGPGRLTGMLDVYNLFNSNSEVNFNLRTGRRFRNIIAALDPRALKIRIRYQF